MKIGVGHTDDVNANDVFVVDGTFAKDKGTALTKNKNPGIAELRMTSVFFLNKQ